MHTQIRIKASDDFADRFALVMAGGRYIEGPHPKFAFQNEAQRTEYNRIRRRIREDEQQDGPTQKGNPDARKAKRQYRPSREFSR